MKPFGWCMIASSLFWWSCSTTQPLQTSILHPRPALDSDAVVAVLQPYDTADIPRVFLVGQIKTPPQGKKSAVADFASAIVAYEQIAQSNGANIIFLNHVRYAKNTREHDMVEATLYRVPDIRAYEKKIFWSPKRKLQWDDFKASIPDTLLQDEGYSSYAHLGIQHRTNAPFLVGTDRFFVLASFDCSQSWYRPYAYFQTHYLEFQQGLFDLTELYARKMRRKFAGKKVPTTDKLLYIQQTDKEIGLAYKNAESQYVVETKGGSDRSALQQWHEKIWKELQPD